MSDTVKSRPFELTEDIITAQHRTNDVIKDLVELDGQMMELKHQMDILHRQSDHLRAKLSRCIYDTVSCALTPQDALNLCEDYRKMGFHSPSIIALMKEVNSKFFGGIGDMRGIHCVSVLFDHRSGRSFITLEFERQTGAEPKMFKIGIPVKEDAWRYTPSANNIYYVDGVYYDDIGKYTFWAMAPRYLYQRPENGDTCGADDSDNDEPSYAMLDFSNSHMQLLAENRDASLIVPSIADYLTEEPNWFKMFRDIEKSRARPLYSRWFKNG